MAAPDKNENEHVLAIDHEEGPPRKKLKVEREPQYKLKIIDPQNLEVPTESSWGSNTTGEKACLAKVDKNFTFLVLDGKHHEIKLGKFRYKRKSFTNIPFGTFWELNKKQIKQVVPPVEEFESTGTNEEADKIISANQDKWKTHNAAQTLSREKITKMREEGSSGKEIVEELSKGNVNFEKKNLYQKEKYFEKKKKKWCKKAQIMRCNSANLAIAMFEKKAQKIMEMRPDTLSQLLEVGNVCAGNRILIIDHCSGLVVASAAQRMGGYGKIYHGYSTERPNNSCTDVFMDPTPFVRRTIINFQLSILEHLNEDREEDKVADYNSMNKPFLRPTIKQVKEDIRKGFDSFILAAKYYPLDILKKIIKFLKPGAVFCIYSQTIEPLMDIQLWSQDRNCGVFNIRIWDNWYRKHQVLPGRTHPVVKMSATGGYLLSGYKLSDILVNDPEAPKEEEKIEDNDEEINEIEDTTTVKN